MAKISGKDGQVLFGSALNITGISSSSGTLTITTATAHGFSVGERVRIKDVSGMTEINNESVVITEIGDSQSFRIVVNYNVSTYTSGGTVQRESLITNWSLTKSISTKDVSDSGSSGGKEFIVDGLYEVSGSFEGFVEGGVEPISFGTELELDLIANDDVYWSVSAIINSEATNLQVVEGDAVKATYDFQGTGSITKTDNTA